jgi:hypothetical protein
MNWKVERSWDRKKYGGRPKTNSAEAFRFVRTRALHKTVGWYNAFIKPPNTSIDNMSGLAELDEVWVRSLQRGNTSDHLLTLFVESMAIRPRLIVELPVVKGERTFVFERVARLCNSRLVSVDLVDCSDACSYRGCLFVENDDIAFAANFSSFCRSHGFTPVVDALFIDTSHEFAHTMSGDSELVSIPLREIGRVLSRYQRAQGLLS